MTGTTLARIGLGTASAVLVCSQAISVSQPDAYRAWRETDPSLEKEASQLSRLSSRSALAWQAAAKYGESRAAFLRSFSGGGERVSKWIDDPALAVLRESPSSADLQTLVRASATRVANDIAVYTGDNDPGIQRLQQSLQRERASLTALSATISDRQSAADKADRALRSAVTVQAKLSALYRELSNSAAGALDLAAREDAAWARYYEALQIAGGTVPQEALAPRVENPPVTVETRPAPVETPNPTPPPSPPPAPEPVEAPKTLNPPPPQERPRAVPLVPLSRYTGEWVLPSGGGTYHGLPPQYVELSVREMDGVLNGYMTVRFQVPSDGVDPVLTFKFSGPLKAERIQLLPLETGEGAKGSFELIPGGAFNLLEVNFATETRPNKIDAGNFILIKK